MTQLPESRAGQIAPGFNYGALAPEIAHAARSAAERVRTAHRRTVALIIEAGQELLAVKEQLGRGQFGKWLEAEFSGGVRTAQNYMAAAERFGGHCATVSHLPPVALYALAAPSTPDDVRSTIVRRLDAGETVSGDEVVHEVRNARASLRNKRIQVAAALGRKRRPPKDDRERAIASVERGRAEAEDQQRAMRAALAELAGILATRLGEDRTRVQELLRVVDPYSPLPEEMRQNAARDAQALSPEDSTSVALHQARAAVEASERGVYAYEGEVRESAQAKLEQALATAQAHPASNLAELGLKVVILARHRGPYVIGKAVSDDAARLWSSTFDLRPQGTESPVE